MEFDTQPTPGGGIPGDYPGKTKRSRPFIGDLPGEGSEGPTDLPNKNKESGEPCPHCGKSPGYPDSPARYINPNNPVTEQTVLSEKGYRGQQQGRGGHFDAGHQKMPSDAELDAKYSHLKDETKEHMIRKHKSLEREPRNMDWGAAPGSQPRGS